MNVADTLYVLVGYKLDESSAKRVEKHFERMRDLAQEMARDTNAAAGAMRYFGKTADKAINDAARATDKAVAANVKLQDTIKKTARTVGDQDKATRDLGVTSESTGKKAGLAVSSIIAGGAVLAGGAAAAAAKSLFDEYKRGASEIVQLAASSNVSVESFSSLAFVAKSAGVEVDSLRDGMNDLSEKAGEAYTALKEGKKDNEYLKTFKELGIDVKAFVALKPDQRFEQFADALNKVSDPGRRSAISMKLMSDEGTKFNVIFNKGTAEIQRLRAEATALGATMGGDAAKGLASYNVAVARFEARVTAVANRLGAEALPMLTEALNLFLDAASPAEIRRVGDGLIGALKDLHKVAIPAIKDLIGIGKAGLELIRELGGVANLLKLILIGLVALKAPAALAVWGAQATAIAGVAKAMVGLLYTFGSGRVALALITTQLKAAGTAAAVTAGKMALVAIPLLIFEDYATWGAGGESVIGEIFGKKTQDNIEQVHNSLGGVGAVLAVIAGLVFGLPAGLAAAVAGLGLYMYAMRQEFVDFFFNIIGLIGIYTQQFLDGIRNMLRAVFVDMPQSAGEFLNEKLRGLAYLGSSGPMPSAASAPASSVIGGNTSTSINSNQAISVQVDARGNADPAAIGNAAGGGVLDAARQMKTQYDSGVK